MGFFIFLWFWTFELKNISCFDIVAFPNFQYVLQLLFENFFWQGQVEFWLENNKLQIQRVEKYIWFVWLYCNPDPIHANAWLNGIDKAILLVSRTTFRLLIFLL